MKRIFSAFVILLITLAISSVNAKEPLAVVVNKVNPVDKLSQSELIDLFMGKYVAFPGNVAAIPVELNGDHKIKVEFYQNLVDMPLSRVNAYWARLRFTGRKRAAKFYTNEAEVIEFIMANENAIGYIPQSLVSENLKVVYLLNE